MHLLGADIVDLHNEDGLVLLKKTFELAEVSGFRARFAPHDFLISKLGCLRAKDVKIKVRRERCSSVVRCGRCH